MNKPQITGISYQDSFLPLCPTFMLLDPITWISNAPINQIITVKNIIEVPCQVKAPALTYMEIAWVSEHGAVSMDPLQPVYVSENRSLIIDCNRLSSDALFTYRILVNGELVAEDTIQISTQHLASIVEIYNTSSFFQCEPCLRNSTYASIHFICLMARCELNMCL